MTDRLVAVGDDFKLPSVVVAASDVAPRNLEVTEPFLDVRAKGVAADGVTDDADAWDTVHTAVAGRVNAKGIRLPGRTSLVSRPVRLPAGVSMLGYGSWANDPNQSPSRFQAAAGFTGNSVVQQDQVDDVGDKSAHWCVWERFSVNGLGAGSGPHGINPGISGEAFAIRNVMVMNCDSGIYATGAQASLHMDDISTSSCTYGVNLDGAGSTVRIVGMSGDANAGALLRVKGGFGLEVTVIGMKAEAYVAGQHDPVILVDDLDGGYLGVFGGWAATNATRDAIVKIQKTGATTLSPHVELMGVSGNTQYTNLIDDTITGTVLPLQPNGLSRPHVLWNTEVHVGGATLRAVTGALSSVTDPAAKAVLTSLLSTLSTLGLLTNGTT